MNTITLFLDFDGVLHPFGIPLASPKLFSSVGLLEDFLRANEHIEVVLSTTWRISFTLEENRTHFSRDMAHRIIDQTPLRADNSEVPDKLWSYPREAECWLWMRRNRAAYSLWLAVDDEPWRFSPFCKDLYLTNPKTGLMYQDILNLELRLAALES